MSSHVHPAVWMSAACPLMMPALGVLNTLVTPLARVTPSISLSRLIATSARLCALNGPISLRMFMVAMPPTSARPIGV